MLPKTDPLGTVAGKAAGDLPEPAGRPYRHHEDSDLKYHRSSSATLSIHSGRSPSPLQIPGPPIQPASAQERKGTPRLMNRPRTGRSTAARDGVKDPGESELEAIKALVREGLLEAKRHNDRAQELGQQIVVLEEDMKSKGSSKF
jgi:hypothetical protein